MLSNSIKRPTLTPAIRLDRLLANLGYGSRTDATFAIRNDRVAVDGTIVRDPSSRVDPGVVALDGQHLENRHKIRPSSTTVRGGHIDAADHGGNISRTVESSNSSND